MTFEQTSFNILLGIGITELLINLVSCHGFTKKPNSTVILNWRSLMVNNHLEKRFFIIEKYSNKLSILPNDVKLIIHVIDNLENYFVMAKNTAIWSVANTIKNCISSLTWICFTDKTSIGTNKSKYMTFLLNILFPSWTIFIIPCWLNNGNKILMLLLTIFLKLRCKATIKEEKNDRNNKTEYWPTSIKEGLNWLPFLI